MGGDKMLDNINLNLLKYFYEVVNTKNITKASENLCVSQPAITKAIKDLENELNVKLLLRSKKGVTPTTEGEILYEHIKDMFNNLKRTFNTIENTKTSGGNLYIGATTTNFLEFIKKALNEFKLKYPNIHIDITLETIDVLEEKAKVGKLDILIKNDYENFNNFSYIKSFVIKDKFIASKKYFSNLIDKKLSLNDILNQPLVLLSNITHGRRNFDTFLKQNNKKVIPTYEFNSYSLCRELIKCGYGIGIGNPIHYNNKDFIILNTDFDLPTRTFHIGYNKDSKNDLIQEFINLL